MFVICSIKRHAIFYHPVDKIVNNKNVAHLCLVWINEQYNKDVIEPNMLMNIFDLSIR